MVTPCQCCTTPTPEPEQPESPLARAALDARNAAILAALVEHGSNVTHAARELGISARQLHRILASGEIVKPPKPAKPAKNTRRYQRKFLTAT